MKMYISIDSEVIKQNMKLRNKPKNIGRQRENGVRRNERDCLIKNFILALPIKSPFLLVSW